ncbi:phospho-N-acetylmuramoyl-pentapeptide-transferase [Bombilactobacillus apium]|nr:phospho-N-acetylmuramoyl-pentapeptide-transferase [Bombilactobacillus apium]
MVWALLPIFIQFMHQRQEGQQILEEGPKWQEYKSGTPTMGGIVFLPISLLISSIFLLMDPENFLPAGLISLMIFLFGGVGFADDFLKLKYHRNLGLRAWQKASLQLIFAAVFLWAYNYEQLPIRLEIGDWVFSASWLFILFAIFWLVGFSNAVNLTDGLDGLCGGLSIIAYGTYAWIALEQEQVAIALVCLAVVGSLLAFMIFNHKPAKVFMGDVGSLALGGGLAAVALILQRPWSLLWVGIIFVLETLSVIIQVAVFKTTGHRVFKMSPIHHHFELLGWSEWKIVLVFWLVGLVAAGSYLLIF